MAFARPKLVAYQWKKDLKYDQLNQEPHIKLYRRPCLCTSSKLMKINCKINFMRLINFTYQNKRWWIDCSIGNTTFVPSQTRTQHSLPLTLHYLMADSSSLKHFFLLETCKVVTAGRVKTGGLLEFPQMIRRRHYVTGTGSYTLTGISILRVRCYRTRFKTTQLSYQRYISIVR
jgi:hypothetical protein